MWEEVDFIYFQFRISNIGYKLPNLRNIRLEYVYFVKSLSDSTPPNEFILPSNLHHFEIYYCKLINNEEIPDPFEFIFTKEFSQAVRIELKLPMCLVPSLKKLTFFYNNFGDCGLEKFLTLNPNLKALTLEYFNYSLIRNFFSIKSLEFKYIIGLDLNTPYLAINTITHLRINVANVNYYEAIKKLCFILPNLEYLYLNMCYEYCFQITIDRFITPVLSNLFKLKTLELVLNENQSIDSNLTSNDETQDNLINNRDIHLAKLPNIDNLILDCDSKTMYNLNFKNCKTLKQVKLLSIEEINEIELNDKFEKFINWKFNFNKHTIRGYNTMM
ncbi:hypothetical protein CONCODRAFT_169134 [Conidiobolus coronatus NRRL 28638]|uniref:RNI-like protein n=1 Tax=Conidiobolus coronatus (strain ATCC 28846 / CBS 209.66 / NRRL 28638) TaxID=796925 RepID=A0A137NSJ2_CONC2|nr:hypothetical protein CONCODRAFT_169134 [Conidiobolus coronatus NRRL 28638]|eukprot:KXN65739.1 hypothetical protein CONCODRAFT_169134 [Conidiobolus coronatus NRRL 28638]